MPVRARKGQHVVLPASSPPKTLNVSTMPGIERIEPAPLRPDSLPIAPGLHLDCLVARDAIRHGCHDRGCRRGGKAAGAGRCDSEYENGWCSCHDVLSAWPPNGSRLSCGRLARRAQWSRTIVRARPGTNTLLPLERSPPATFKRLLGGWRPIATFLDVMILLVPPSHELRVLFERDPRDVVSKLRIAAEGDRRDVPLDPSSYFGVRLRTGGALRSCEGSQMLLEERNRGDGEARPGRVFNDEIVPASQPDEAITGERGAEAIRSIEGGRSLLEQYEVVVSVPPFGHGQPPNGPRVSCGRLPQRRKGVGRQSRARQGTTQWFP